MIKSNNSGSCIVADSMVEYFNNVEIHKDALDAKLQEKFGEYASVDCTTVANENGGDMFISFGKYDIREELMSFAGDVARKLDISIETSKKQLQSYLDIYDVNADITWSENPEECKFELFFDGKDYREIEVKENDEWNQVRFEFMEALDESIKEFVNSTMKEAVQLFVNCWVMEYSAYECEEDELED